MSNYDKNNNPFTLQFSFVPPQYIDRKALTEDIVSDLNRTTPAFRGHFLTGVRGCGKSVLMAEICEIMSGKSGWLVVDIADPTGNIVEQVAKGMCRNPELRAMFLEAKLDISVLGIGISVEKAQMIASDEFDAVDMMLKVLHKRNIRVLVAIDEVTYCERVSSFSHAMSAYARAGYEIYAIMTGLKENIRKIKNNPSLTFLYRAKAHELEPLNITAIIAAYTRIFNIDRDHAEEMAWLTKGYSLAFQVLGYLYWDELSANGSAEIDGILNMMDQYLAEFSYDKIWSELAPGEQDVMIAISRTPSRVVSDIRESLKMNSSKFGVYRERLIEKGLINGNEYGKIDLALPRFDEYARLQGRRR